MSKTQSGFQPPSPSCGPAFHGTATVNDKGQIVIPAEARKALGIESGDKLLAFAMHGSLMLSPASEIEKFAAMLAGRLDLLNAAMSQLGAEGAAGLEQALTQGAGEAKGEGRDRDDDGDRTGSGPGDAGG